MAAFPLALPAPKGLRQLGQRRHHLLLLGELVFGEEEGLLEEGVDDGFGHPMWRSPEMRFQVLPTEAIPTIEADVHLPRLVVIQVRGS